MRNNRNRKEGWEYIYWMDLKGKSWWKACWLTAAKESTCYWGQSKSYLNFFFFFFRLDPTVSMDCIHVLFYLNTVEECRDFPESWETHRPVKASSSPSSCCSGISSSLARPPPPPPPAVPFTCPSSFKENTDFLGERSRVSVSAQAAINTLMVELPPLVSRQDFLWWLNADFRIPFSRREDNHFIQKLIYACDEVFAIPGLVGYVAEELREIYRI